MATLAREISTDNIGGSLSVIDVLHLRTHQGLAFGWNRIFNGVANGSNVDVYITVDANESLHCVYNVSAFGSCEIRFYENPTVSVNGTAQASVNRNRYSSNLPLSVFYYTPTVTTVGTLIFETLLAGGGGGQAVGSASNVFDETILKSGNTYLLRTTNTSGVATSIAPNFTFYIPQGSYVGNNWSYT